MVYTEICNNIQYNNERQHGTHDKTQLISLNNFNLN